MSCFRWWPPSTTSAVWPTVSDEVPRGREADGGRDLPDRPRGWPLQLLYHWKATLNLKWLKTLNHLLNQSAWWQNIRAIVVLLGHLNGSTLSGNRAWWAPLRLLLLNPIPSLWLFRVLSLVYTTKDKTLNKHELTNYIGCNAASNVAVHSLISYH